MGSSQEPPRNNDIEECFGALGSSIRVEILKRLDLMKIPLSFGEISKFLTPQFNEGLNLSYHLKKLKDIEAIFGNEEGYQLSPFGQRLVEQLISFEDVVLTKNSSILIRTSRYKLEEFDESIIEQKLIEEAAMPAPIAKKIAIEAKRRLLSAKVTYLTSPLIREYVNAILIENQMEDYRHKLTRLGLPAYDIKTMLNSNSMRNPLDLKVKLGKSTLEQYTLLNQLSQGFADKLLSTEFVITDLELFGLSPLEILIKGGQFFKAILDQMSSNSKNEQLKVQFDVFYHTFLKLVHNLQNLSPYGLSFIRFDEFIEDFLQHFTIVELEIFFERCLQDGVFDLPLTFNISLDVNFNYIIPIIEFYEKKMQSFSSDCYTLPVFQLFFSKERLKDLTKADSVENIPPPYNRLFQLGLTNNLNFIQYAKWGSPNLELIYSNLHNPIVYDKTKSNVVIVLEKIYINFLHLWHKSAKNDSRLLIELEKALFSTFDYYELKFKLLTKNLPSFKDWKEICKIFALEHVFNQGAQEFELYSGEAVIVCPVAFFGLERIQKERSGYFTKDLQKNRDFAKQIYDSISNLINKHNSKLTPNIRFVLTETCDPNVENSDNFDYHSLIEPNRQYDFQPDYIFDCDPFIFQPNANGLNNLLQTYADLKDSKYDFFSVCITLQDEKMNSQLQQQLFEGIKALFQTNVSRIGINQQFVKEERPYKRKLNKYK